LTLDADADIVVFSTGQLSSADTIIGGTGTDVLRTTGAVTMIDADFTNVQTTEVIDAATNAGPLNVTLGALATAAGITTVTGSAVSANTINAAAFTGTLAITGSNQADNITGGTGIDVITGGAGADVITLTADAAADILVFNAAATNGVDSITGFAAGAGVDIVRLVNADTTVVTAGGADAVFVAVNASPSLVVGTAFNLAALALMNTTTTDVIEILGTNADNGNLGLDASNGVAGISSGIELLKLLGQSGDAATGITMDAANDMAFVVAYDNGNAYLYHAASGADGVVASTEITLVGVFNNVAVGAFATGDFVMPA
jgi:hypothetical protein